MTLAESEFLKQALADIEAVKSEAQLVLWMDKYMAGEEYIKAPDKLVNELELAYQDKCRWIMGAGGG